MLSSIHHNVESFLQNGIAQIFINDPSVSSRIFSSRKRRNKRNFHGEGGDILGRATRSSKKSGALTRLVKATRSKPFNGNV